MASAGTALIVGAGIGGLAAATSLRQAGWTVRVYERAQGPGDLGFALALAANAMSALEELGIASSIRSAGHAPRRCELTGERARVLKRFTLPETGTLVVALRRTVHSALLERSDADVRNGEVMSIQHEGDHVSLALSDGSADHGDVLIGADGVGSIVRKELHPGEDPPRPSGYSAIRGITFGASAVLGEVDGLGHFGDGCEAAAARAGGDAIYWYYSLLTSDLAGTPREPRAIASHYAANIDGRFQALVDATATDQMRFDELFRRAPLPSWGRGRITLLGDAAHPVLPHTGQGAAQALEDAVALGLALRPGAPLEPALRRYEQVRAMRTKKVIALGPRIARMTTTRNRWVRTARTIAIRLVPQALIAAAPSRPADPHKALR